MNNLSEFSFWGSDLDIKENFTISISHDRLPIKDFPERIQQGMICLFRKGNASIMVDGVKYTMTQGMILSVFPQQVIEQLTVSDNLELMYFTCTDKILSRILFHFPMTFEFYLKEYPTYNLPESLFKYYTNIMYLLYQKYNQDESIVRNDVMLNFLRSFFLEIYNGIHQKIKISELKQFRQHEIFRKFIDLLITGAKSPGGRKVQYYADKLNITPKYLSVVSQLLSEQGAKKIIDNFIIMEVKLLLKSTNLTMQEITNTFNFPDQAFFTKFFKSQTGFTPKQYRSL
ncbi:helix-turn-helix domain-containing protein [Geofilum sp. OHC36d9]|uniref:helix-turn-helix domain-containing protein n=1 Tax=Geofilum sp. OHC36d9 TaxID=3458413 RepID=UPI00403369EC